MRKEETGEAVFFGSGLLDRVFMAAPAETLLEVGTGAAVSVEQTGFKDVVLWNPHETCVAVGGLLRLRDHFLVSVSRTALARAVLQAAAVVLAVVCVRRIGHHQSGHA